ncbi:hypothetical protein [Microbacterium sp. NIBRBAC000506063]|uniref:hypothetical protein n=1 Tax=Microbacterium sp. NIBRBAC000506063 TaxID=2734618 RepID=UPI001BB569A9|nr:hypothetical protein [Microbacterium sp. NIBRBAC000506063]QTV79886.1 hypothetical protein KAE78_01290 [Microbacterium sp. NIBRBAC000506063]
MQLRQHNTETGETNTFTVPTGFGVTALRGAVSPVTGIFYFSGANAVYAFDPATDEIFAAGSLPAGNATSNGDFAFGRNGALYTFVAANLYETPASALPTSASSDAWPMKLVADVTAFTDLSAQGANGIAFGGNGNVYGTTTSGNTTYLIEYDMARDSFVQQQTISSDGNNFVDLASRHFVNTLTIRIDLPEGRFADGDQFDFDLVGEGDLVGGEATTSGNSPGVQDEYAGPVVASPGGTYEVSTSPAGSTDLSNYITSIECVDVSGAPVEVTGTSPAWNVVFPTVTSGTDVECTITATPSICR